MNKNLGYYKNRQVCVSSMGGMFLNHLMKGNFLSEFSTESDKLLVLENLGITQKLEDLYWTINNKTSEIPNILSKLEQLESKTEKSKGFYSSYEELIQYNLNSNYGDWAIVNINGTWYIYKYLNNTWTESGIYNISVDLSNYVTTQQLSNYVTSALNGYQTLLRSGINIKTINGLSILGSGNITIQGGSVDTYTKLEIGNIINSLANVYYNQSLLYTKSEVDSLISLVPRLSIKTVELLPTTNIDTNALYFLILHDGNNTNYELYIYNEGLWKKLSNLNFNFDGYITSDNLSNYLTNYITSTLLLNLLANYVRSTDLANYDYATRSELPDTSNFYTKSQVYTKTEIDNKNYLQQSDLKTINGQSIIGSGDITGSGSVLILLNFGDSQSATISLNTLTLKINELESAIDEILSKDIKATISVSPNVVVLNGTTTVTITAKLNNNSVANSITINGGGSSSTKENVSTHTITKDVGSTTLFSTSIVKGSRTYPASATVTATNFIYIGSASAYYGVYENPDFRLSLRTSLSGTFTINVPLNGYKVYIIIPNGISFNKDKVTMNGFGFPFNDADTSISGYSIYESRYTYDAGNLTIVI